MTELLPLGLLAELTHRCPLQCPYCSNPTALDRKSGELDTGTWMRVFSEAIEQAGALDSRRDDVEQRLPQPVGSGTQPFPIGSVKATAFERAGDDAHKNFYPTPTNPNLCSQLVRTNAVSVAAWRSSSRACTASRRAASMIW